MRLEGIFPSIATPFDHNGDLYQAKLKQNFGKWNLTSVSGYVVGGPAGEGALLTSEEKATLWTWAAEYAASGKVVVADVSAESVRETVLLCGKAAAAGCKGALAATPRIAASEDARALYFRAVADRSELPIILRKQAGTSPHPNVVAVLDSVGEEGTVCGLPVLTDSAAALWTAFAAGATGAVLDFASAAPYSVITIWEAFRKRDAAAGQDWQERIRNAAHLVTEKYGVPGLKYAMDLNGYYGGPCRLPLLPLTPDAKREIGAAFRDLKG